MSDDIATLWDAGLDPAARESLQQQLHGRVRAAILSGALPRGERVPASRALAGRLGVARITVTQAYDQLVAEGYLETRHGAGTFVAAETPDQLLATAPSNTAVPSHQETSKRPLYSGMPALDQFPTARWGRLAGRAARALDESLMHHSDVMGYAPLRSTLARHLQASRNLVCTPDQIMIVSGLQQGLFLVGSAALAPDGAIIMEDPGYSGMRAAAEATRRRLAFTGVDASGALPPECGKGLLVTSPSRHYPLGYTMPHARRLELLAWARETGSLIFEDDYDSEFRYAGRPLNSLQGIDGGEHVVYGGTFSKTLFPAIRLGYLVLPHGLIEAVRRFRAATDSFPSIVHQAALHLFIEEGDFARHIRRLRKVHAARHSAFMTAANAYLTPYFDIEPSDAGLSILAWPRACLSALDLSDDTLAARARAHGIGAVALSHAYRDATPKQGVIFGFANLEEDEIAANVRAFARSLARETGFSTG